MKDVRVKRFENTMWISEEINIFFKRKRCRICGHDIYW